MKLRIYILGMTVILMSFTANAKTNKDCQKVIDHYLEELDLKLSIDGSDKKPLVEFSGRDRKSLKLNFDNRSYKESIGSAGSTTYSVRDADLLGDNKHKISVNFKNNYNELPAGYVEDDYIDKLSYSYYEEGNDGHNREKYVSFRFQSKGDSAQEQDVQGCDFSLVTLDEPGYPRREYYGPREAIIAGKEYFKKNDQGVDCQDLLMVEVHKGGIAGIEDALQSSEKEAEDEESQCREGKTRLKELVKTSKQNAKIIKSQLKNGIEYLKIEIDSEVVCKKKQRLKYRDLKNCQEIFKFEESDLDIPYSERVESFKDSLETKER